MANPDVLLNAPVPAPAEAAARIIKPLQFDDATPQTTGMHRLVAVSHILVGSEKLWAGVTMAEPGTASSVHHHGPLETVVYVAEGTSKLRWGRRLEHESDLEAGDFLFIPPYLPHQEINPSTDRPALWVVVRSAPEAVVVELTPGADGEYVTTAAGVAGPSPLADPDVALVRQGR
jgi:uncharacterized RmlC-like cupin family protein